RQDREDVVRVDVARERSVGRRRCADQGGRPRASLRFGRTRGTSPEDRRRQPRSGRAVSRRQRKGVRLLRRPSDEGDAGPRESTTPERAIARSARDTVTADPKYRPYRRTLAFIASSPSDDGLIHITNPPDTRLRNRYR